MNKVAQLEQQIIFEDNYLLVLNKPSGLAVHGGSGLNFGAIEALRTLRPKHVFELAPLGQILQVYCLLQRNDLLRSLHEQLA